MPLTAVAMHPPWALWVCHPLADLPGLHLCSYLKCPHIPLFSQPTLPLGKFLLQDPPQGSHTPESISWLPGPWRECICVHNTSVHLSHNIWGQTAPQHSPHSLRALVCYSHHIIIFACRSSRWFIQLVLEKIPNSRPQKSCLNLKPKCTKNKAGISVFPLPWLKGSRRMESVTGLRQNPLFRCCLCVHGYTHTHTHKVQGKREKSKKASNRRNVYKKKSCVLVFRLSLFSLIECQSFLLLAWNQVSFMISEAKTLCTFLCQNTWGERHLETSSVRF